MEIAGEPWFVAADVCRALGLHIQPNGPNVTVATRKLAADEKTLYPLQGKRKGAVVSVPGLYKLIMRSDKPRRRPSKTGSLGKFLPDFMRSPVTKEYIAELSSTGKIPAQELVDKIPGNRYIPNRSTWAHPKLAVFFAPGQTQGVAVADHAAADLLTNPMKYIEALMGQAKKIEAERDLAIQQKEANTRQTLECAARSMRAPQWATARYQQDRRRSITEQLWRRSAKRTHKERHEAQPKHGLRVTTYY
ncbi:BRO family protein [Halomonas alkalisoli]|uniref:BRO family protein n=1 Tax=Halomonas alkalisoli TaxID=2907158 RepID=UPI0034E256CE